MRDITADRTGRDLGAETVLVDNDQHIYIPIFDRASAAPNCPSNYWWTETKDPRVRVAQKVVKGSDNEEQFPGLAGEEVLPAASTDLRLDYAFYKLGKIAEGWMAGQKLDCPGIRTWEGGTETEVSSRARRVILAGETSWYSLKCRQK